MYYLVSTLPYLGLTTDEYETYGEAFKRMVAEMTAAKAKYGKPNTEILTVGGAELSMTGWTTCEWQILGGSEKEKHIMEIVCELIADSTWDYKNIGTKEVDFYIKHYDECNGYITDIDAYACLNNLMGYDIGWDKGVIVTEKILSLTGESPCDVLRESNESLLVMKLIDYIYGLKLNFDNFKTTPTGEMDYYL